MLQSQVTYNVPQRNSLEGQIIRDNTIKIRQFYEIKREANEALKGGASFPNVIFHQSTMLAKVELGVAMGFE